ncbi:Murein hydrolase activator NlpD [Methylophilaceae bacterium]|nr:Murein hydrolase activator NlpD [Methylophilaceae bacterium]
MRFIAIFISSLLLISCSSTPRAPVIDRAPGSPSAPKPAAKATEKDWRPDTYTVKKGDTLYSIGLEYGYDYREIAQTNNIPAPYTIYIGQQLKLKDSRAAVTAAASDPAAGEAESSGVVITPLDMGSGTAENVQSAPTTATAAAPPLISEPKALREPYSEQALNAPIVQAKAMPAATPPATAATGSAAAQTAAPAAQPAESPKAAPAAANGDIAWAWPATGKVIAGFNEGGNAKGIDIGGTTGQPIKAAAPGKVIYSGSDLRGYGKLVIVKHNATYLSVYAHNSKILVKEGEQVSRGQQIAEMGSTDTDRTKLHFEIRRQGKSVDPASYLPANPG